MSFPPPSAPLPPRDEEQRNIIDRLATFVAKNGPDFEEMTRQKQQGNQRFAFLFGGEFSQYYHWRLMTEISALHGGATPFPMGIPPPHAGQAMPSLPPPPPALPSVDLAALDAQIAALKKQISDSEINLRAQRDAMEMQKQSQIDAAIEKAETAKMTELIRQVGLNVQPLSTLLDQLTGHCSKEVISSSKRWIFENCTTDRMREVILMYLLYRVKDAKASSQFRLHILYLVNDWAHYCMRKKLSSVTQMLSRYVPQLYAFTSHAITADPACKEKLEKLFDVWEKHKYFDDNCHKQLRSPAVLLAHARTAQLAEWQRVTADTVAQLQTTYLGYEKQHQDFERHVLQQLASLEQTRLKHQGLEAGNPASGDAGAMPGNRAQRRSRFDKAPGGPPESGHGVPYGQIMGHPGQGPPPPSGALLGGDFGMPPHVPPPMAASWRPGGVGTSSQGQEQQFYGDFGGGRPPNYSNPHPEPSFFNCPPPSDAWQSGGGGGPPTGPMRNAGGNFGQYGRPAPPPLPAEESSVVAQYEEEDERMPPRAAGAAPLPPRYESDGVKPQVPYYELPAGIMLPLIKLEDCTFKALNPSDLRLPPPMPPSERLLMAIKEFYAPPSADNPRDVDGWERRGLYDYYVAKNSAKQKVEEALRAENKTLEDAIENVYRHEQAVSRREKRSSPRRSPSRRQRNGRVVENTSAMDAVSTRSSRRQSRLSPSKEERRRKSRSSSSSSSSSSGSSSSASSSDDSKDSDGHKERRAKRARRRSPKKESRSRSASPVRPRFDRGGAGSRHSPSPPTFRMPAAPLNTDNRGAQLMAKMGWQGRGLGSDEQGIAEPVSGGEVRDRVDQFRGIGSRPDAFDEYRKQQSGVFQRRQRR